MGQVVNPRMSHETPTTSAKFRFSSEKTKYVPMPPRNKNYSSIKRYYVLVRREEVGAPSPVASWWERFFLGN